jgi:aminopeptidase-like protein
MTVLREVVSAPVNNRSAVVSCLDPGQDMYGFMRDLYPVCRSITGNGVRETLHMIGKHIELDVREVPTGTPVFDWTVPKEWNIRDAYIKNHKGERIVDFRQSNLHVLSYSIPVRRTLSLGELKPHLFSLPAHPDWIPYRTSYYNETWGFCITHNQFRQLTEGQYEVCIDSTLEDGSLTYGEMLLPGALEGEMLLSCHICHPSLCNDNLSGVALTTYLAKHLASVKRRYSYRFLFIPATIGSITWLAMNESQVSKIRHGLVVACVGDGGKFIYKKSRQGAAEIDKAVAHILRHQGGPYEIVDFSPYGYDERQYCSPAFNLPVGSLTRSTHGRFQEYHTSADNLDFVKPEYLAESFWQYLKVIDVLEHNKIYVNENPRCEPQLGKRGLYRSLAGQADMKEAELALLWVLNLSDGRHSLLDIAERSGLEISAVKAAADALVGHGLLAESVIRPVSVGRADIGEGERNVAR